MAINLDKMREKLGNLKGNGNNFWKLKEGNHVVRILPTEDGDPFKSFHFHYGVSQGGILCPKANFGEACPICDFVAKLFSEKDDESREMAKKLMKKQRFSSPVLVRGEEKEGAKIWSYSKTVYEFLISAVLNPDYGDITDLETGVDIEIVYGKKAGKKFPDTDCTLKRKSSKMCKEMSDKDCKEMLENLPDFDKLHKRSTVAEVQQALDKFLAGEPDSDTDSSGTDSKDEGSSVDDAIASLKD